MNCGAADERVGQMRGLPCRQLMIYFVAFVVSLLVSHDERPRKRTSMVRGSEPAMVGSVLANSGASYDAGEACMPRTTPRCVRKVGWGTCQPSWLYKAWRPHQQDSRHQVVRHRETFQHQLLCAWIIVRRAGNLTQNSMVFALRPPTQPRRRQSRSAEGIRAPNSTRVHAGHAVIGHVDSSFAMRRRTVMLKKRPSSAIFIVYLCRYQVQPSVRFRVLLIVVSRQTGRHGTLEELLPRFELSVGAGNE